MKVAIYCKTSAQGERPEKQRAELESFAKRMGHEHEIFEEKDSARGSRPVKYALLKRLRAKEFNGLVVWRLDSWAKNRNEMISEISDLLDRNIFFVSLKDGIDLSGDVGKLLFHMFSVYAGFDRKVMRESILLGLEQAKRAGKKLGRPFGARDMHGRKKPAYLSQE